MANTDHAIHAGLVAVEAMAQRFDLWNRPRRIARLDPRWDWNLDPGPDANGGQVFGALSSGGGGHSECEALPATPCQPPSPARSK